MGFYKFDNLPDRAGQNRESRGGHDLGPVLRAPRAQPSILDELIEVLLPFPGGLRRWSVMRGIRENRRRAGRDTSLKFEIEVERVFRGSCGNGGDAGRDPQTALFYRPEGKAGDVWAVHAERAKAWIGHAAAKGLHEQ
jgi:hypothetical protein